MQNALPAPRVNRHQSKGEQSSAQSRPAHVPARQYLLERDALMKTRYEIGPQRESRANVRPRTLRRPTGADMTARIPENFHRVGHWSIVTIMGKTMPPR